MQLIASDKPRVVIGLGLTGMACARHLAALGEPFAVADSREQPPGLEAFRAEFSELPLQLGPFAVDQFVDAEELLVSPGVSLREPAIATAAAAGVRISGDIDLFCAAAKAPIAAITGSNGKSTVTTLLGKMAARAGLRVAVGGNLGTPALDLLDEQVQLYVLELSSFQLERCAQLGAEVAVVLNVSEDHIDHHGSLVAYHQAKHRIFRGCRQALYNRDDALTEPLLPPGTRCRSFGLGAPDLDAFGLIDSEQGSQLALGRRALLPVSALKMPGRHNVANALAALALGHALGLDLEAMLAELREFTGLAHRCQFVAAVDGADYYDDSKGTNVGAAVAAMRGLAEGGRKLVLIAGGQGKGASFEALIDALLDCGRAAVLIGESATELQTLLDGRLPAVIAADMSEAVARAQAFAEPGDAVLLSPACASFDMFSGYQQRGEVFQAAVRALASGGAQ